MNQFSLQSIRQELGDHPWADNIVFLESTDSTNTQAKKLAIAGAPHGTVVIAAHQTAGRGRMGRQFHSPENAGIYMSIILRPNCTPDQWMHLTCAAGVATCDAVEEVISLRPSIKWINDLVWEKKKLAGILAELIFTPNGLIDAAIVGIGINCNQSFGDFPPELHDIATSLSMVSGQPVSRSRLAAALIRSVAAIAAVMDQPESIMDKYRTDCITIGQAVSVHQGDTIRYGTALSVNTDGGLMVIFETGETESVASGEVSVRGMYGYV